MIDSITLENIRASIRRYEQIGPDFMRQSQTYTKVLFEEVETLRKTLSQRLQELEELKNPWRPIASVPKDGTPFLCGWWSGTYWWAVKAHWANGAVDGGWDGARQPIDIHPTHWMPLPGAPREAVAGDIDG